MLFVTRINFNLKYILLLNYIPGDILNIYVLLEIFLIFETILYDSKLSIITGFKSFQAVLKMVRASKKKAE